jgi:hypothetical protein
MCKIFHIIFSTPQNNVMDLNNDMMSMCKKDEQTRKGKSAALRNMPLENHFRAFWAFRSEKVDRNAD